MQVANHHRFGLGAWWRRNVQQRRLPLQQPRAAAQQRQRTCLRQHTLLIVGSAQIVLNRSHCRSEQHLTCTQAGQLGADSGSGPHRECSGRPGGGSSEGLR